MKTNSNASFAIAVPKSKSNPGTLNRWRWLPSATMTVLLFSAAVAGSRTVLASDPVGIYALVDKVVLEPSDSAPERIQIWGVFSIAKPGNVEQYHAPEHGYLYYRIKSDAKSICEKEWSDLKALAGTHQCVAFAGRYQEKGRVRPASDKPTAPDEYPVAQGLTKIRQSDYPPVKKLFDSEKSTPASTNPQNKAGTKSN